MLQTLQNYLDQRLQEGLGQVKRERFAQLVGRLLATGVLWRDYSTPEASAYDDASEVEELLREYFGSMGFTLTHDVDANLFRLYPPGASADGEEDEDDVKKLKARLSRDFVAAAMALRFLYTEALTGKRELINEVLTINVEELSQTVVSLLSHTLPPATADRAALLRELRKHRIVKFKDSDTLASMDTLLNVLRPVMSYVSDEALQDALALAEGARTARATRAAKGKAPLTDVVASGIDSELSPVPATDSAVLQGTLL